MSKDDNQPNNEFDEALVELQRSSKAVNELLQQETVVSGDNLKEYAFLEEQFREANERFKKAAEEKFGDYC